MIKLQKRYMKSMKNKWRSLSAILLLMVLCIFVTGCDETYSFFYENEQTIENETESGTLERNHAGETETTTKSFETYSTLDGLGRCGTVEAAVGEDIMPTKKREAIGQVKPSGWHTVKYDCVNGKYLYNRCHIIGYQLTGENANKKNLITGTRYLNVDGMLPFEDMVADYVKETGNHVMYKVTPIYEGNNLVADGVEMQAYSVEDSGGGVSFHVYCYNVQPGVEIDYSTGDSRLSTEGENGQK